eukprot:1198236-Amphidinium_carterae.1
MAINTNSCLQLITFVKAAPNGWDMQRRFMPVQTSALSSERRSCHVAVTHKLPVKCGASSWHYVCSSHHKVPPHTHTPNRKDTPPDHPRKRISANIQRPPPFRRESVKCPRQSLVEAATSRARVNILPTNIQND